MSAPDFDVRDYHGWLYATAHSLMDHGDIRFDVDDLVQEGRIAMLRSLESFDRSKGALPTWVTGAARQRMLNIAQFHGRQTGHEPLRRGREVDIVTSLERMIHDSETNSASGMPQDVDVISLLGYEDDLFTVQDAVVNARVAQAMAALDPAARRYVYARFWLGLDPSKTRGGTRELIGLVDGQAGEAGSATWKRARTELVESLGDLRQEVAA